MNENFKITIDETTITNMIVEIRGQKVMLDFDLAMIYGYETKYFNRQVKNNIQRFPSDFMFQLTIDELNQISRCKNCTAKSLSKSRYLPHAFTEQGIYMLMTILKGELAITQSKQLIRCFKEMKDILISKDLLVLGSSETVLQNHERRLIKLEDKLDVFARSFIEPNHFFISKNQRIEADMIYQDIFSTANESIVIVDNYLSIKTLNNLKNIKQITELVFISDNVAKDKIKETELLDFKKDTGVDVILIPNKDSFHDRYIVIDRDTNNKVIYHCGSSEKDAGNAGTTIDRLEYPETYLKIIDKIIKEHDQNQQNQE